MWDQEAEVVIVGYGGAGAAAALAATEAGTRVSLVEKNPEGGAILGIPEGASGLI